MKNFISLLIFLLFAWLGIWWYYSCDWCAKKSEENSTQIEKKSDTEAEALAKKAYEDSLAASRKSSILSIKDHRGEEVFSYPENLKINNTNGEVYIPESLKGLSGKIADYLGEHQDQEVIISGYENSSETENSSELGISRANFIKNLLVDSGVNPDRIVTKPQLESYNYDTDGNYNGGIHIGFNQLDEARISEIEKGVANKTLYSKFAQKTFTPDATLTNYTLELRNYLDKYPNKSVQIIGHTDDVGKEEANLWYGQERANNVKNYLISQGIPKAKIKALSEGETNPIAPNDSEENKAKNRRIEIIVN